MKTVLRSALTLLFCLSLCLCLAPVVFAAAGDYIVPANTVVIEAEAFAGCKEMVSITIPASVKRIEDNAFSGCENLKIVYYEGTPDQWNRIVEKNAFGDIVPSFNSRGMRWPP